MILTSTARTHALRPLRLRGAGELFRDTMTHTPATERTTSAPGSSDLLGLRPQALLLSQDSAENHPLALLYPFGQFPPVRVWLQELGVVFGSTVAYLLLGHALRFTKGPPLRAGSTYVRGDLSDTPSGSRAESDRRYLCQQ